MRIVLRRSLRLSLFALHILAGIALGAAAHLSRRPERISQLWFRGLLRVLNVRVDVRGEPMARSGLFAGNHVSWLDIAVLVSARPVIFVSKAEVRDWPVVGWLARAGDTQFIERGAHGTQILNRQLTDLLGSGRSVVIFPEGTTTAGPGVRRFHSRLFAGAIHSGCPIQPFALRYRQPSVPYVGEQSLVDNLWQLLAEPEVQAELAFGPPLPAEDTRKAAARDTQERVERALEQPPRWQAGSAAAVQERARA